jgi:hypothetical protein
VLIILPVKAEDSRRGEVREDSLAVVEQMSVVARGMYIVSSGISSNLDYAIISVYSTRVVRAGCITGGKYQIYDDVVHGD